MLEQARHSPTPTDGSRVKKALYSLPITDHAWIIRELERYRRDTKMRLNKSQLVQVALELLRNRGGLREALKELQK